MFAQRAVGARFAAATASMVFLLSSPADSARVPPGFADRGFLGGLDGPISFQFGSEGEIWIGERGGRVLLASPRGVAVAARLPTSLEGERGILGIAIDPRHAENAQVWIYYSTEGPSFRNRLSRFRRVGDHLVDETVVLETPELSSDVHNGGWIAFETADNLFLSTGDDRQGSATAQDPFDLRGKILRMHRDGGPAEGNPFASGADGDPRVWALGFRNPWRFSIQPGSGNLFIGDVGASGWEELDIGVAGGNFGWRLSEGPEPPGLPGIIYPVYAYPHTSEAGHAIIAGGHAPEGGFPPEYAGNYFFADHVTREIFRMVLDQANAPQSVEPFAEDLDFGPVDLKFGPDGALYYLTLDGGELRFIAFEGGVNGFPVARALATPDSGRAPLMVTFDGSSSSDPDGEPLRFEWSFGDGTQGSGAHVVKQYPSGVYSARLTVTDAAGGQAQAREIRIVSGNERPEAVIQTPAPGTSYVEGETIAFRGMGLDPERGQLSCQALSWFVVFHHAGHTHPFLGPIEGACDGSFVATSHGEEETFFEIRLTAKDDGGALGPSGILTGNASLFLRPRS